MKARYLVLMVTVLAAGIAGCATTEVTAFWKDAAYTAQPKKVLVISLFKDQTVRRLAEDEFKSHLKFSGVDAAAGYEVFPGSELPNKEKVVEQVKAGGYDAVLLTRLIDTRTEQRTIPATPTYATAPHYGVPMQGYYGQGYTTVYAPAYQVEDKFATVEANLYDAATEKLVWTATSDTWMSEKDQKLAKTYVAVMMESMRKQKLFP